MAWSCVIGRRNTAWTDYRGVKVFFSHVPSGWLLAGTSSVEREKRANCSSVCLMCETTWGFFPRSTILARNDSWEIFHRHFPTLRSLVPRESLMTNRKLRRRYESILIQLLPSNTMASCVFSTNGAVHCKDWDNGPAKISFKEKR